jgi:nucleoside phosphorylase
MIAVTFALPAESKDFLRLLADKQTLGVGTSELAVGRLQQQDVAVFHTGVGESACRRSISNLLIAHEFEYLISAGFAGATDHRLRVGDLLLAENFSDPKLIAMGRQRLPMDVLHLGTLFTARSIVENAGDRAEVATQANAIAVDMETEFIRDACVHRNIPLLGLRAISDTAERPFPCPAGVLFDIDQQRTIHRQLFRYLLTHPATIPRLATFSGQIAKARRRLTRALQLLLVSAT